MTENEKLLRALKEGKVELLENVSCDEAALADDSIQVALRRAAERVVSHRLNYRATIQKAVELGVPCDIWTAARAGLLDVVKKHIADDASLLDAEDDNGRTALQRSALIYGACDAVPSVIVNSVRRRILMSHITSVLSERQAQFADERRSEVKY